MGAGCSSQESPEEVERQRVAREKAAAVAAELARKRAEEDARRRVEEEPRNKLAAEEASRKAELERADTLRMTTVAKRLQVGMHACFDFNACFQPLSHARTQPCI